ncbi:putative peptidase s15 [Rosellinia necatrix]|uniref:Putative peptidase s15 n=1 Tax=Rosellinia necatrix TaxID=77044 RepID=A0A1W2TP45_ROSNE|nr:putative peptidase s15 [Rosellinia necatrix]
MASREDVEFTTMDGLTLRGCIYPAAQRGPAIILTPGFNFTKEMIVAEIAEHFQRSGFTALTYDPRSIGQSDGLPRNDIDPSRNVEDYHDALTFLKRHPLVDPSKMAFWGYSFSGMVALVAAALDKRAKAVVAMCPLTIWEFPEDRWARVLAQAMRDRESRVAGNRPVYIPMLTEDGENPAGFGAGFGADNFRLVAGATETQPDFELPTTLSSYYRIAAFQPFGLIKHVSPTPAMVVIPEDDAVSPAERQRALVYDVLREPKNLLLVPGKGHMDVLSGEDFDRVLDAQVQYLRAVLHA